MKPQIVVVTGASAGIGRAVATAFGARGATVGVMARGEDGLDGAAREVERRGGTAVLAADRRRRPRPGRRRRRDRWRPSSGRSTCG